MKLRYYSDFKSIKENAYRLEIHTTLSTHSEPITLSPEPFIVEYESSALYQPLKLSGATVSLLTGNILTDLYTGENQGVQVRLYNQTANALEWVGYLTTNLYSSDYITPFDSVELEAIDTLSSLENIKYSYISDNGTFRSFADVLFSVLDKADPGKILNKVFIQKTNRMSKDSLLCLFAESYIHERNFFDEDNEPATCRDVLESLAQYYGMTVIQWRGAYYLIDYDFINRGNFDFFSYDRVNRAYSDVILTSAIKNVSNIGVAESTGSISLGDVYNKVSVVASMNVISSLIPDIMDEDDIINQNEDANKYYVSTETVNNAAHTLLTAFFKSKNNWDYLKPNYASFDKPGYIEELNLENLKEAGTGAFWQKCDSYNNSGGEPSSISWKSYFSFIDSVSFLNIYDPFLSLKSKSIGIFKGGYFIIDLAFKLSSNFLAHDILHSSNEVYSWTKFGAGFTDTLIPCRLKISDHYYNGEYWVHYDEYRLKISKDYYKKINMYNTSEDLYWFRYVDSDGLDRYTTESEWNSLPSTIKKDKGHYTGAAHTRVLYYYYDNSTKIFVPQSFYYECILKDRFYLVHRNNEGDKVFDEEKSLTNTVSYKMNLVDSADGVAIKLPTGILFGELELQIDKPNHLGIAPMWTTDGSGGTICRAFHFTDLSLKYTNNKSTYDVFNSKSDDLDTVYSNKINDSNVAEMDDITLTVNSYSKGVSSYSNTATKVGDKFDYIKDIYSPINDARFVPEQILIDKLYRHYCSPKFKYQNCLNRGFDILSRIKENSLRKTMVVDSTNINYANESCLVTLIEV